MRTLPAATTTGSSGHADRVDAEEVAVLHAREPVGGEEQEDAEEEQGAVDNRMADLVLVVDSDLHTHSHKHSRIRRGNPAQRASASSLRRIAPHLFLAMGILSPLRESRAEQSRARRAHLRFLHLEPALRRQFRAEALRINDYS